MTSNTIKHLLIFVLVLAQGTHAFPGPPEAAQQIISRTIIFSDCSEQPLSKEESLQLIYDRTKLIIIHNNAWLNCAAHGSELVFKQDASGATHISESEIRGNVVDFCLCYYTAVYEMTHLKSGQYKFEIQNRTEGTPASIQFEIKEGQPTSTLIKIRSMPPLFSGKSAVSK